MLEVENLSLTLPDRALVQGLSFRVAPGQVVALLGPSGGGKSTVLDWMTGLLSADIQASGRISLHGQDLADVPCEARRMGLMTQTPLLFPHFDVLGNLKFGARDPNTDFQQVLSEAGLAGVAHQDVATLSGGQVARVSLLRTLLSQPKALLLDEPFARLDVQLRDQIREFVWQRCPNIPVVLVTHDEQDIPSGAQRIELADYAC